MSLLSSTNSGSASVDYFIRNIGGPGNGVADAPVIKGSTLGTVLIGAGAPGSNQGLRLRGDTVASNNAILGNQTAGGSLTIGNSVASFQNVILTDGATATATDLYVGIVAAPAAGNIVLSNGQASGKSISGYWNAITPSASYPASADTPIANPAGLTAGWYILAAICAPGGQAEESVSTIVHFNGTLFDAGGACQSVAGSGSFGFKPSDDRTAMRVHNDSGAAQTAIISWAKLLN